MGSEEIQRKGRKAAKTQSFLYGMPDSGLFLFEKVQASEAIVRQYPQLRDLTGIITQEMRLRAYWGWTHLVVFDVNGRREWWLLAPDDLVSMEVR